MIDLAGPHRRGGGRTLARGRRRQPPQELVNRGLELMLEQIRADLLLIGVRFDHWQSERALFDAGEDGAAAPYEAAMSLLREGGYVVEKEGGNVVPLGRCRRRAGRREGQCADSQQRRADLLRF